MSQQIHKRVHSIRVWMWQWQGVCVCVWVGVCVQVNYLYDEYTACCSGLQNCMNKYELQRHRWGQRSQAAVRHSGMCEWDGRVSETAEWVGVWVRECGAPVHVYVALLLNYFRDCWRGGSGRRQWITVCACMHVYIYVYVCGVYFSSANKTSIAWYKLQITLNRLRLEARWSTLPQVLDVSMPRCLRSVCVVCTFHAASARRQHAAGIHLPCLVCLVAARALLTQVLLIICHLRAWHMLQQQQQRTQ